MRPPLNWNSWFGILTTAHHRLQNSSHSARMVANRRLDTANRALMAAPDAQGAIDNID